jgi:hypothetical protein
MTIGLAGSVRRITEELTLTPRPEAGVGKETLGLEFSRGLALDIFLLHLLPIGANW